jgi:AraC-like DNA-binding protein
VTVILHDAARAWRSESEALAAQAGTSMAELSRLAHQEWSVALDRCRAIGHLTLARRDLVHTTEQVAQIAYPLEYDLRSTFDNRFKELVGRGANEAP